MSAVLVDHITKQYGTSLAVNDLSFEIKRGECLGLLGSNGAGKSTTIKIMTGQLQPHSGAVAIGGINPARKPKAVHSLIGYIPDRQSIYEDLTVWQNIDIFRKLFSLPRRKTAETINSFLLNDIAKKKVKVLSKGLKQRVLLARSLIHSPQIILLDEPTTGLDPSLADLIYKILEDLKQRGSTILLTTHLMNDVERLCDRIVFLDKGKKIEEGTPFELKRKYREPRVLVQFLGEDDTLYERSYELNASLPSELQKAQDHVQGEGRIYSINTNDPKLEDIFIKLTSQ